MFQKIYGQLTRGGRDYSNNLKEVSCPNPSIPWFNILRN